MPSDAEVEAAARAICKIHARNPDHRVIPTDDYVWWQTYESDARAALEAAEAVRKREAKTTWCDCERSHNGLGLTGRECDCPPGGNRE